MNNPKRSTDSGKSGAAVAENERGAESFESREMSPDTKIGLVYRGLR